LCNASVFRSMMTPSLLVEFVLTGPGFGRSEAASLVVSIPDGPPNQTTRRSHPAYARDSCAWECPPARARTIRRTPTTMAAMKSNESRLPAKPKPHPPPPESQCVMTACPFPKRAAEEPARLAWLLVAAERR